MKKIISFILCFVMITSMLTTYALTEENLYNDMAICLKQLGLFKGVSDTEFDLHRAPTRTEAIIMLIRVLGNENKAASNNWEHPFDDVETWANNYVGYAYNNGLSKGISNTKFGTENADSSMYLTFVLRALGYSDTNGEDFEWNNPFELAEKVGISPDCVNTDEFMRKDVVAISYAALSAKLKNSEQTLAQKLIESKVFAQETFDKLYNPETFSSKENIDANITEDQTQNTMEAIPIESIMNLSSAVVDIEYYHTNSDYDKNESFHTSQGFLISPEGILVTTYSSIKESSVAVLTLNTGEKFKITNVLYYDEDKDIAILKTNKRSVDLKTNISSFQCIPLGNIYKTGSDVYTFDNGLESSNKFSEGKVLNDNASINRKYAYIETNINTNSRNAGAPLINEFGQAIGILAEKYTDDQSISIAIPTNLIERSYITQKSKSYKDVYINNFLEESLKYNFNRNNEYTIAISSEPFKGNYITRKEKNYVGENVNDSSKDFLKYNYNKYFDNVILEEKPDDTNDSYKYIYDGQTIIGTFSSEENVDYYKLVVPVPSRLCLISHGFEKKDDEINNSQYLSSTGKTYSSIVSETLDVSIKHPDKKTYPAALSYDNEKYSAYQLWNRYLDVGTYYIKISQNAENFDMWKDRNYCIFIMLFPNT